MTGERSGLALALLALALAIGAGVAGEAVERAGQPRLVGFECLGASGPIYANEESDFPPCLRIERSGLR